MHCNDRIGTCVTKRAMAIPTIDMAATGKNICRLRKEAGFSVRELQDFFGFTTPQAIYKWQKGAAMPSIDNLVALAFLLGASMDEIVVIHPNLSNRKSA